MKDTHSAIEEQFLKMIMKKSGEERMRMGFDMDETARKLVTASVLYETPQASEKEIKIAIFNRFYGNDFSPEVRENFIKMIKGLK